MTDSTDQTASTEAFAALTVDELVHNIKARIARYSGMVTSPTTDAVDELARRVRADRTERIQADRTERAEYVRTGLRLAMDLGIASGRVAAAAQVIGFHPEVQYRDLLAAELAALTALTAHLAAR